MTLRKWFYLFWSTLGIGAVLGVAAGIILQLSDQEFSFFGMSAVGFNLTTMALGGAMISVLCQMGFFAYLIIRYIGIGIIRNKTLWDFIQITCIIIAIFDLTYLRNKYYAEQGMSFIYLPILLLILGLAISLWKVRLTNKNGFIPTLFFMVVVTILEAVPALKLNNAASDVYMLFPIIGCNAWQILILQKIVKNEPAI